ncbi:hypothetical protein D3C87_1417190 [compost metagenome]
MRREAGALAAQQRDLVAQPRRQVAQLFLAFDQVLALKAQQQAHVVNLKRLQARRALRPQVFQASKEVLACQLLTEQGQLQRLQHPGVAYREAGIQHGLVDGGAEGVLGGVDVFRRNIQFLGGALVVGQKLLYARRERGGVGGLLPALDQEQHQEAVVEQVQQRLGGPAGMEFGGTLRQRCAGHQRGGVSGHGDVVPVSG